MNHQNDDNQDNNRLGFNAKRFLSTLPHSPGIYRMFSAKTDIIYIGKAKNLKKRVASYFRKNLASERTAEMVKQIANIEVTLTETEVEALLLESNLIKKHQPKYNILLRDDKGYPYIYLSTDKTYPRLSVHRGARKGQGEYYGPYPSTLAVRDTLRQLQKLFKVRQCEDSYFNNRSRPCLQYQIKRCSAPCTDFISKADYDTSVEHTQQFLKGNSDHVIASLVKEMDDLSQQLRFEEAAERRDLIEKLRMISQQQYISGGKGHVDVVALDYASGVASVQVLTIRNGHNLGNKNYFPRIPDNEQQKDTIMAEFIAQYYVSRDAPNEVIVNVTPHEYPMLQEMLTLKSGHKVLLKTGGRTHRAKWLSLAERNARHALQIQLASKASMETRLYLLQEALNLDFIPNRMECFDISHTQGEATVASCVVFGREGAIKADYRRYNIKGIELGDDYAAMRQVLSRRFKKAITEEAVLPDILFIDGGKGQVKQAHNVLQDLHIDSVEIVGIVKGEGRKASLDNIIVGEQKIALDDHSPAMHLIQQIRDESHRFAITGHRQQRQKARTQSQLEDILGLGPKRRQQLLKQFGGIRAVSRASVDELAKIKGISRTLAEKVYGHFNAAD